MTVPTQNKAAWNLLVDDNGNDAIGKVVASPEVNTVLGRLKDIADGVGGNVTVVGPLTDTELRAADVKITLDSELVGAKFVDENGTAYGVKHIENKPRVSSMPYLYDIAEGSVSGHTAVRRFGHNGDVGTALEAVSDTGGTQVYLTSAEQLQVVSADANDDDGDTGARTVQISGLDANYAPLQETVTLNGTANVQTTGSFLRVWQANVLTAGSSGTNEGIISIKDNAAANTLLVIQALEGQSHAARVTVPAGKTFYLAEWYGSEASSKAAEIHLFVRNFGGAWRSARVFVMLNNIFVHPSTVPLSITEKSDIEMRAKGLLAGANVTGGFDGWWE